MSTHTPGPEIVARLIALRHWNFVPVVYQQCRFCGATPNDLWKYGVRHYICNQCRNTAIKAAKDAARAALAKAKGE